MLLLITTAGLACLIALSIYDLREGRLPNWLVAALAALGGAYFFLSETSPSLTDMAIGLVVGPGILLLARVLFWSHYGEWRNDRHRTHSIGNASAMNWPVNR